METLDLNKLPEHAKHEIIDFYEFLLAKHTKTNDKKRRPYALAKNDFDVPGDFNKPLPPEYLKYFNQ